MFHLDFHLSHEFIYCTKDVLKNVYKFCQIFILLVQKQQVQKTKQNKK